MAQQPYEGPGEIYINGRLMAEASKVSITVKGNNNPVTTMQKGLAGKSDGARSSEGTIESAIPRKGFERNFIQDVIKGTNIRLVMRVGKTRLTFSGWMESTDISQSVDAAAVTSASFMGGPPDVAG